MTDTHIAGKWFEESDGTQHWRCTQCGMAMGVTNVPEGRHLYPDTPPSDAPCIPLTTALSTLDQLGYIVTEAERKNWLSPKEVAEVRNLPYESQPTALQQRNQAIGAAVMTWVVKTLNEWVWGKLDDATAARHLGLSVSDLHGISHDLRLFLVTKNLPKDTQPLAFHDTVPGLLASAARRLNMSFTQIAELAQLPPEALIDLEQAGDTTTRRVTLQALVPYLDVSYEYLCYLEGLLPEHDPHPDDRVRVKNAYTAFYRTLHPTRMDATLDLMLYLVGNKIANDSDATIDYTLGHAHRLVQESLTIPALRNLLLPRLQMLAAEALKYAAGMRNDAPTDPEEERKLLAYTRFKIR